jgi:multicomponent Na+:H+ antiporter subunit E
MYKYLFNYHFILYIGWLIVQIFKSGYEVAKIICSPRIELFENFRWIDAYKNNDIVNVIYANSITLTPGTITLDIKNDKLLIHALQKSWIDDIENNKNILSKIINI